MPIVIITKLPYIIHNSTSNSVTDWRLKTRSQRSNILKSEEFAVILS